MNNNVTATGALRKLSTAMTALEKAGDAFTGLPDDWPSTIRKEEPDGAGESYAYVSNTLTHDVTGMNVKKLLQDLGAICKSSQ